MLMWSGGVMIIGVSRRCGSSAWRCGDAVF